MKDKTGSFQPNIIHGSLPLSPNLAGGDFVMAEATDTRLMGVVGVHIQRRHSEGYFHQLFYLDFEEYGLDDYKSFHVPSSPEKDGRYDYNQYDHGRYEDNQHTKEFVKGDPELEKELLFGGLGGKWVPLSEGEAICLIKDACRLNDNDISDYPEGFEEYRMILTANSHLDDREKRLLWKKISCEIHSDYELINYFIMRHAAMDEEGESYLSLQDCRFNLFHMTEPGTLYRNENHALEEESYTPSSIKKYMATSLISDDFGFRLLLSRVEVAGSKVVGFDLKQDMRISHWEASLIMARQEYVSVFNLDAEMGVTGLEFFGAVKSIYPGGDFNSHTTGNLLMIFKEDNRHVDRQIYRLDEDVKVSIFVGYNNEVLIAGYDLNQIYRFEESVKIVARERGTRLLEVERFAFPESTLGHYIQNDYGIFRDFLEFIQFLISRSD